MVEVAEASVTRLLNYFGSGWHSSLWNANITSRVNRVDDRARAVAAAMVTLAAGLNKAT